MTWSRAARRLSGQTSVSSRSSSRSSPFSAGSRTSPSAPTRRSSALFSFMEWYCVGGSGEPDFKPCELLSSCFILKGSVLSFWAFPPVIFSCVSSCVSFSLVHLPQCFVLCWISFAHLCLYSLFLGFVSKFFFPCELIKPSLLHFIGCRGVSTSDSTDSNVCGLSL